MTYQLSGYFSIYNPRIRYQGRSRVSRAGRVALSALAYPRLMYCVAFLRSLLEIPQKLRVATQKVTINNVRGQGTSINRVTMGDRSISGGLGPRSLGASSSAA